MSKINNVHDKFFKQTMTDKKTAISLLKNYLPTKILNLIDFKNIELEKDSMIEEELKDVFSDIIYKVRLNGKEAYLYFLFEHKSYPSKKIALQLLKYMRNIWDLKMKQGKKKLPLIIPLVIYHGKQKWNIGLKLSNILDDIPDEIKEFIPDFKYLSYDFSPYSNQEIKGEIELQLILQILRYIFVDDILFEKEIKNLIKLLEELNNKETATEYFELLMRYIMNAREGIDAKELSKIVGEVSSERGEAVMTIAEKLKMEGKKEIIINMVKEGMDTKQIVKVTKMDKKQIELIKEEIKH